MWRWQPWPMGEAGAGRGFSNFTEGSHDVTFPHISTVQARSKGSRGLRPIEAQSQFFLARQAELQRLEPPVAGTLQGSHAEGAFPASRHAALPCGLPAPARAPPHLPGTASCAAWPSRPWRRRPTPGGPGGEGSGCADELGDTDTRVTCALDASNVESIIQIE